MRENWRLSPTEHLHLLVSRLKKAARSGWTEPTNLLNLSQTVLVSVVLDVNRECGPLFDALCVALGPWNPASLSPQRGSAPAGRSSGLRVAVAAFGDGPTRGADRNHGSQAVCSRPGAGGLREHREPPPAPASALLVGGAGVSPRPSGQPGGRGEDGPSVCVKWLR